MKAIHRQYSPGHYGPKPATSPVQLCKRRVGILLGAAMLLALRPARSTEVTPSHNPTILPSVGRAIGREAHTPDHLQSLPGAPDSASRAEVRAALERLPLHFIENRGQADPSVAFYVQGQETSVYFTSQGVTFALTAPAELKGGIAGLLARTPGEKTGAPSPMKRWAVKLDFLGANSGTIPTGKDRTPAVVSYFKGKKAQWKTGLANYSQVVYEDLWPGIDLVYSGTGSRLKYTFLVQPGADPKRIQLRYRGATAIRLTEEGRLLVETPVGSFEDDTPYAYQEVGGKRVEVEAAYELDREAAAPSYGFRVGSYDTSKPLVLDPVILTYCGYIGGSGNDPATSLAVDTSGNVYVTGSTISGEATFPETVGPDLTYNGGLADAFVAKVNSSGTSLIYCGYIGGSAFGLDIGRDIAVDGSGNAYVVGQTPSTQAQSFPVTVGPDLTYNGGGSDVFVAKVNAAGTALDYCGYIGGSGSDEAYGIDVDAAGNAYVAGWTASDETTFPETVGPDLTYNGGISDTFVAKVNSAGTGLDYCGYIGGSGNDPGGFIDVDSSGSAYVTAWTTSTEATFPDTVGPDLTYNGGSNDAFVAKVNASGTALDYCGYIGGTGSDEPYGIAVDGSGNAYVAGYTTSSEATFPETVGPDLTYNGGTSDAFVAKVNSGGTALSYCGYIGGSALEYAFGIALDGSANAYVAGYTTSTEATFPVIRGPDQTSNGGEDAFVAKLNASGTALTYCGFIGGSGNDQANGIAVDGFASAYISGSTASTETTFPAHVGPDLTYNGGGNDTFVAKVEDTGGTAVELVALTATGFEFGVLVEWRTASELNNLGFHLYRSVSEDGPYVRITSSLIPGLGSSPEGARYRYLDSGLANGVTYYYKLEDIETTGHAKLHGPVSGTPQAGAGSSGSGGSAAQGPQETHSLISYGNPSANRFEVVRRTEKEAVLELITEGFYAEPLGDGTVRLSVPGFEPASESGSSIPVKRPWVDAVAGVGVRLVSVKERRVESFTGLRPPGAELFEVVGRRDGTVRLERGTGLRERSRQSPSFSLYPAEGARLLGAGFQGEVKKVQVELAPLKWDGTRLVLAKHLVVRLSFDGKARQETSLGGRRGRLYRERSSHGRRGVVARLATREPGLHAVRHEEILRRWGRVAPSALRLSRLGKPVAFHTEPSGKVFGPGSRLYFLSAGAEANPYGHEATYELELVRGGVEMAVGDASPAGKPTSYYWKRLKQEVNRFYQPALLQAPDPWLWDVLMAPVKKSYSFNMQGVVPTAEASRLSVWLQGASDLEVEPDHHLRVYANGSLVGEIRFEGKRAQKVEAELAPGVLREGENVLELENLGDTGAQYSMVFLDRFELMYARAPQAEVGRLAGIWSEAGVAEVMGVGASGFVLDVTNEGAPVWLKGVTSTGDGAVRLRVEAGRSYLVAAADSLGRPEVRLPSRSYLKSGENGADYLVIGPAEFLDESQPLLELRRSQGLRVKAVALEQVYEEFGFGESRSEAIGEFLQYAFHRWKEPSVRYVVLVGDATYDYKDYLGTGVVNRLPPLMVKTSYLWTVSDPTLAAVNGDDSLPDVAMGRLPAATEDELRVMVQKIVDYESRPDRLSRALVLVSDNPDSAGNFVADAEEIAEGVLAGREVRKLYLTQLGASAMRSHIIDAFDEGASLMSYIGHGGIYLWANENIFSLEDVASLSEQSQQPLLLTMNCLNGYFHFPYFNSLAEEVVKAEGRGAIAAFSPSGFSRNGPAHLLHQGLLEEIFDQNHERLGDAVLAAQAAYGKKGVFPELLTVYHLLGDPALKLH